MKKKLGKKVVLLLSALVLMFTLATTPTQAAFNDISGKSYEEAALAVQKWGVMQGKENNNFCGDENLTRAQMAQVLVNLIGYTQEGSLAAFSDVGNGAWYDSPIAKCVAAGVLQGNESKKMEPNKVCSFQTFSTMLFRALKLNASATASKTYTDAGDISSYAQGAINTLTNYGAIQGYTDGSLKPTASITRGRTAQLLYQGLSQVITSGGSYSCTDGIVVVKTNEAVTLSGKADAVVANATANGSVTLSGLTASEIVTLGKTDKLTLNANSTVDTVLAAGEGSTVVVNGTISGNLTTGENCTVTGTGKVKGDKNLGTGSVDKMTTASTGGSSSGGSGGGTPVVKTATEVWASDQSPTGYYVTYRYQDDKATRVRLSGDFSFTTYQDAGVSTSGNVLPQDWQPGMFYLKLDNSTSPVFEMVKEGSNVWSYTMPLPQGSYTYAFYVGYDNADAKDELATLTNTKRITDKNQHTYERYEFEQNTSTVYVPYSDKQAYDYPGVAENSTSSQVIYNDFDLQYLQADYTGDKAGKLETFKYDTTYVTNNGNYAAADLEGLGEDEHPGFAYCTVYLPYNYSATGTPMKVMYLSHGAGNPASENSWTDKGRIKQMMDNMIAEGKCEPFVIVSIDNYCTGWNVDNFYKVLVPAVEAQYNVSTDPADRAVAGFSMGGYFTSNVMLTYPDVANSYGVMSMGVSGDYSAVAGKTVYMACGIDDGLGLFTNFTKMESDLTDSGVTYKEHLMNGGHDWYVWRMMFADMISNVLWK